MNEQDFSKIFEVYKQEFSDNGFSEQIIKHLPERKSVLPQIVMTAFVMLGLVLTFVIQDFTLVLEQINSLVNSINQLQIPSASAIIIYLSILGLTGLIGYSVVWADVE